MRRFEFREGISAKFWEISLEGTSLETRYGKLGGTGQSTTKTFPTPEAASKEADRLIREKTGKGYVETGSVLANDSNPPAPSLPAAQDAAPFRLLPAVEAFAREPWCGFAAIEDTGDFVTSEAEGLVLLVEGDWSTDLKGERSAAKLFPGLRIPKKKSLVAVLVRGDLRLPEAVLVSEDLDYSPALAVGGNLEARALVLEGGSVRVKGELRARELIYGFYNHGDMRVEGRAASPLVLAQDYTMAFPGGLDCPCVMSAHGGRLDVPVHHRDGELAALLHGDLLDAHGHPDRSEILAFLKAEKSLLRPVGEQGQAPKLTLKKAAQARLDQVLGQAGPLLRADLTGSEFTFLPEELRAHAGTLTHLDLSRNPVQLPGWIGELESLEWMRLDNCGLTSLPEALGRLPRLRHLSLSRNALRALPECFANLESLVVGDPYCDDPEHQDFLFSLKLSRFPRLRHFVLGLSSSTATVAFEGTFSAWASESLEHLKLEVRIEGGFPSSLKACPRLESLQIALGPEAMDAWVERLPDMAGLEYLRFALNSPSPEQMQHLSQALPSVRIHVDGWDSREKESLKRLNALCEPAYAEKDREKKRPLIAAAGAYAREVLENLPGPDSCWVSPIQRVWAECWITAAWDELRREVPDVPTARNRLERLEACLDGLPFAGSHSDHATWGQQIESLRTLIPN